MTAAAAWLERNGRDLALVLAASAFGILLALIVSRATRPYVPDFSEHAAGDARKAAFFDYFLPLIEQRNREIRATRQQLREWRERRERLSGRERRKLTELASRYHVNDFEPEKAEHWKLLLRRVDIVPPSLALAQAANESAWGTSRFSREGYNYFGQWCFEAGCGMVPASRDAGKTHEVAAFDSPHQSVEAYIRNLNRHSAYRPLREIRESLRNQDRPITGVALTAGLGRYSERGDEYVTELRAMIRYNDLAEHDPSE